MGKKLVVTIGVPIEASIHLFKLIASLAGVEILKVRELGAGKEMTARSAVEKDVEKDEAVPVEPMEAPATPAWQAAMEAVPEETDPHAGRRVVYRVIDPTIQVSGVPGIIKSYLLMKGPCSAQDIGVELFRGKKSIESALHMLRVKGCVESVPVEEGQ